MKDRADAAAQGSQPLSDAAHERPVSDSSPEQPPARPWRTEGLPEGRRSEPRRRWITAAIYLAAYLLLFGILTVEDRLSGPQPVPYTEFKSQVANKNVAELFARRDSIDGQLKKAVPLPDQRDRTYQQFTTERPTFANDDRLTESTEGDTTVRATPLVEQRGFLTNLLISVAPMLLLVGFYGWMFRRQQSMAGGLLTGSQGPRRHPESSYPQGPSGERCQPRSAGVRDAGHDTSVGRAVACARARVGERTRLCAATCSRTTTEFKRAQNSRRRA